YTPAGPTLAAARRDNVSAIVTAKQVILLTHIANHTEIDDEQLLSLPRQAVWASAALGATMGLVAIRDALDTTTLLGISGLDHPASATITELPITHEVLQLLAGGDGRIIAVTEDAGILWYNGL
ncbi:MAG: hypothetical protein HY543_04830, partial [Deltaproteobacteria bacterium]|nr:hypothetical protein [Deltaproteobacteria bacterium]